MTVSKQVAQDWDHWIPNLLCCIEGIHTSLEWHEDWVKNDRIETWTNWTIPLKKTEEKIFKPIDLPCNFGNVLTKNVYSSLACEPVACKKVDLVCPWEQCGVNTLTKELRNQYQIQHQIQMLYSSTFFVVLAKCLETHHMQFDYYYILSIMTHAKYSRFQYVQNANDSYDAIFSWTFMDLLTDILKLGLSLNYIINHYWLYCTADRHRERGRQGLCKCFPIYSWSNFQ